MNDRDISVRVGFVLLPQFAMGAFAAFTDLLGLLDAGSDAPGPCAWEVVAETLSPVRSASGIQIVPTSLLDDPARFDVVVVVGGPLPYVDACSPDRLAWLRQAAQAGCHVLGLYNGVFALAQAGVLAGHRVCVGADHYHDFLKRFPTFLPEQIVTDRLSVFDRRRLSCAGGPAVLEVAVRILKRTLPEADVQRALRRLQFDQPRPGHPVQPPPPGVPDDSHPAVRRAVLLMEQYAGTALSLNDLAERLGLSARQLQRLFRQHLATTPQAYARDIRLRQVAWKLEKTSRPIAEIASECGFADAAHMGRSFRAAHGMAPGAWRRKAQSAKNTV